MMSGPRMTLSSMNATGDSSVRLWLLSATNRKGKTFYRVAGRFTNDGQTWEVYRRYSEFLQVREKLIKFLSNASYTCPGCQNYLHAIKQFAFPKKHLFVSKSQAVVNYRTLALRAFVNLLASWTFSSTPKCPTCGGFAFDLVRSFLLEGAEPIDGSDMGHIRDTLVISSFTNSSERPSSMFLRSSERRPSWAPSSNTERVRESVRSNSVDNSVMDEAYETFNSYMPAQVKKNGRTVQRPSSAVERKTTGNAAHETGHDDQRRGGSMHGSFIFYNDSNSDARSDVSFGTVSTEVVQTRKGILKNKNDPINVRPLGDSFLSLGSDNASFSESGFDYGRQTAPAYHLESPHASALPRQRHSTPYMPSWQQSHTGDAYSPASPSQMLSSPNHFRQSARQYPAEKKSLRENDSYHHMNNGLYDSFISDDGLGNDSIVLPESIKDDQDETSRDTAPTLSRRKSTSGEGLWQPWELARAG